ncbi:MAG: magnesium transporter [Alphaproteobacteria bacterium]|jgi:magnesium transporter|nr:magnesium transporter [Alphaproteobacteria bacterium]
MIRTYRTEAGACVVEEGPGALERASEAAWIDLFEPTHEEDEAIEKVIGAAIPTREDMAEIEASSRLYEEVGAVVMTTPLLVKSASPYPESAEFTFVLTEAHLVTVRYAEPVSLSIFAGTTRRTPEICASPKAVLTGLLDAIVDRLADVLEVTGQELDSIGRRTFTETERREPLQIRMQQLGRHGEIVSKARESLVGLARLVAFLKALPQMNRSADLGERLQAIKLDIEVLLEHTSSLSAKITFLLDALLGMINIEQNAIIKTFSVVAVMFLPPTLIASIYGMNFEHMPELSWPFGYPLALLAMLLSMIAPYAFFKRKGWI